MSPFDDEDPDDAAPARDADAPFDDGADDDLDRSSSPLDDEEEEMQA